MMEVFKPTEKKCKRCHGKGWAQWGSLYGPCNRCGGESGVEYALDVPATRIAYEQKLAELRAEGEAHKATLEAGLGGVLALGRARRGLDYARRTYGDVLTAQRKFLAKHGKEVVNAKR